MTFEEFFQKKKIDLEAFGRERPGLLKEFREHFEQMGEKSFDHTKKYWFNKLRRAYPLQVLQTAAAPVATSAAEGRPPARRAPAFRKPAAAASAEPAQNAPETTPPPQVTAAPGGSSNIEETTKGAEGPDSTGGAKKPAYRPRFAAGKTIAGEGARKTLPPRETESPEAESAGEPEKSSPSAAASQDKAPASPEEPAKAANDASAEAPGEKSAAKTPYKPRFRPGVTPKPKE